MTTQESHHSYLTKETIQGILENGLLHDYLLWPSVKKRAVSGTYYANNIKLNV